jgi:hypothetical protein
LLEGVGGVLGTFGRVSVSGSLADSLACTPIHLLGLPHILLELVPQMLLLLLLLLLPIRAAPPVVNAVRRKPARLPMANAAMFQWCLLPSAISISSLLVAVL